MASGKKPPVKKIAFIPGQRVTLKGNIARINFKSDTSAFIVFLFASMELEDEEIRCVGSVAGVSESDMVEIEGVMENNSNFGPQIRISSCKIITPEGSDAVLRYLSSGAIKGIGPVMAMKIVNKFGSDTFRIMEEEPERLAEIKGISLRIAQDIGIQMLEKKEMRETVIFMSGLGLTDSQAVKIHALYKEKAADVIRSNPYRLAEDIRGIGFATTDAIAEKLGFSRNSEERIRAGIFYVLNEIGFSGHTCMDRKNVLAEAVRTLNVPEEAVEAELSSMELEKKIVNKRGMIFLRKYYSAELGIAQKLKELQEAFGNYSLSEKEKRRIEDFLEDLKSLNEISLDDTQMDAVCASVEKGVFIITGGPGTGKTSTIRAIIRYFDSLGQTVALCAPTGRAAKRMEEATGYEAKTIHRLLEVGGSMDDDDDIPYFNRNEMNPLETDVVIVDEMSMVDTCLFYALLSALPEGTRLILSGDYNQLPSVGAGNVLRDLLKFSSIQHITLEKIYRQSEGGDIVAAADRIRRGLLPEKSGDGGDFFFVERTEDNAILRDTVLLLKERIPKKFGIDTTQIQVLTPVRAGNSGVKNLNEVLQNYLNPKTDIKAELGRGDHSFRLGDKVMQTKNNYNAHWVLRGINGIVGDEGDGVYNGDIGIVTEVDLLNRSLTVTFEDQKEVEYSGEMLDDLEPAYAITIHKSQGSEYPAVIIILSPGYTTAPIYTRNLLYTAVSRGTKCVMILGSWEAVKHMTETEGKIVRYTGLFERLTEVFGIE